MSFSMTEDQILARTKTVTRRIGWKNLQPGTKLRAVHKCMGFKKGEQPRDLAVIEILAVWRERLCDISEDDVAAEGYPGLSPIWFVTKFCKAMRCTPETEITRIEFRYAPAAPAPHAALGLDEGQEE